MTRLLRNLSDQNLFQRGVSVAVLKRPELPADPHSQVESHRKDQRGRDGDQGQRPALCQRVLGHGDKELPIAAGAVPAITADVIAKIVMPPAGIFEKPTRRFGDQLPNRSG